MEIILIAAVAANRVIGNKGDLPWYIPADLQRFKKLTLGYPVIMGRTTYESIVKRIGKPLPDRVNIVLTHNKDYRVPDGVIIAGSVEEALKIAEKHNDKVYVIGGQKVYDAAFSFADTLEITHVHKNIEGDAHFPVIDSSWRVDSREDHVESDLGVSFTKYRKKKQGLFITFEGIDGCGKSTQLKKFVDYLFAKNKHNHIVLTREPYQDTNIRKILHEDSDPLSRADKLADLFILDRKKHVHELIIPSLDKGHFVVSDRYKLSTIAYQSAQGLSMDEMIKKHEGLPVPFITFVIDVSAEEAAKRMKQDSIAVRGKEHKFEADVTFSSKIRDFYHLAKQNLPNESIFIINGERSPDEITKEIISIFESYFDKHKSF